MGTHRHHAKCWIFDANLTSISRMGARHNSSVSECREILKQEYLTTLEASTLLRVSKRTIFNLVKRGELQAIKLSHRITLIPIETLLSMVNQKEYKHISVFAKERNKSPKGKRNQANQEQRQRQTITNNPLKAHLWRTSRKRFTLWLKSAQSSITPMADSII
ncbi:helix-turn-helix domain-containing protein [Bacteroides fragilis]|uniref:helix-turn-helix domain-containing protein n=1 Tax=Bacteroides fragilis TaxID=817 RepID=UPI002E7B0C5D|nr:helix-turn-helix domain-containing protein [Bacteroides fragilis]